MKEQLVSTVTTSGFQFGHVPIADSFDQENMIGMIAVDRSGSVSSFQDGLERLLQTITKMNQKLPTKNKIMQRVTLFGNDVKELHGLQLVDQIDPSTYNGSIQCGGMTALRDAVLDSLEASEEFCRKMIDQDYDATACIFILTDGCENNSVKCRTNDKIAKKLKLLRTDEKAFTSPPIIILIGVNVTNPSIKAELDTFAKECTIDKFMAMEDVTESSLGKLAGLISQSFSSKSQNVTSKNIQQQVAQITI
jgi:hypothetical protein